MSPVLTRVLPLPTNLIPVRQIVGLTSKVLLDGLKLISPGLHYVNVSFTRVSAWVR